MVEFYEVAAAVQVRVGTKVELWLDGRVAGWGEVTTLLPERQVLIERLDEDDERYVTAVEGCDGEVYVDEWSPQVRALIAEDILARRLWTPAEVESFHLKGFRQVRVGTKLEIWDGTEDDEYLDWGEVTHLLAGERVAVYWHNGAETTIAGAGDGSDLYVDDWSPVVYSILRKRAKEGGQGHGTA